MTPTEIDLIRASWSSVEPIADTAAGLFYGRLFELDPAIERLRDGWRSPPLDARAGSRGGVHAAGPRGMGHGLRDPGLSDGRGGPNRGGGGRLDGGPGGDPVDTAFL